jgi:hypothetical protein
MPDKSSKRAAALRLVKKMPFKFLDSRVEVIGIGGLWNE